MQQKELKKKKKKKRTAKELKKKKKKSRVREEQHIPIGELLPFENGGRLFPRLMNFGGTRPSRFKINFCNNRPKDGEEQEKLQKKFIYYKFCGIKLLKKKRKQIFHAPLSESLSLFSDSL